MTDKPAAPITTFESSLDELEKLVTEMEEGELPLHEALSKFEKGVSLARQSQLALEQAEQKVQILLKNQAGEELADFQPSDDDQKS